MSGKGAGSHKHGAVQGSLHGNSPAGSGPATPANGKQGSHPGPSDNGKAASKDLTRQGGGPPDQHPPDPHHIPPLSLLEQARGSAGSTAPGDRPSFNRTGSVNSNRSSFASEGFGSKLMQARMSGTRGSHDAATPPAVLAPVDEGRSSQQARLSSIAAADVMGLGGEKAGTATTRALPASYDPLPGYQPPAAAAGSYPLLGALPPETPVPLDVLQRLWKQDEGSEALAMAQVLAGAGVLRLATLEDGSRWVLPAAQHLAHAAAAWPGVTQAAHGLLLDLYTRKGSLPLEALRDDGYIVQALSHHLMGAGRLDQLRRLVMNPGWLEAKLHAYGIGAVVRDFRRYLQEAGGEESMDVKLLLQAFQLSLGAAMEHPTSRMMREQMLARLMAVANAGRLQEWFDDQTAKCAAESMLAVNTRVLHLMPRTPSLTQAGGVHRMTLRGHSAPISRVAIAPNCCDVVTISEDGSAQVWDMNIGDCVMQLARDSPLTAVAITPDSLAAVVGAADGTAAVWDLAAGRVTHTLAGHGGRINALAVDKQGLRCVTVSDDHTGRVWSVQDGSCEAVLRGHGESSGGVVGVVLDVCISSDGVLCVTASDDFSARVWDLDEDGEQLHVLEGHGGWVTSCAFIGTTQRVITASHDSTARIWDALRGRCLATLSGHSGRLNRVSVDPGGSWAITTSDDQTARVWNVDTFACEHVLEGHSAYVADAAIARDCSKAVTVSGDGTGMVWDLPSGKREEVLEGHTREVHTVVLTQRGRFAVTASADSTARVWDLAAAPLAPPPAHGGKVTGLQALPDGQLLVSAGEDGHVFLWDPIEGTCLKRKEGHRAAVRFMMVSSDGALVLTGSGDRQICCWNWAEYSAVACTLGRRSSVERRDMLLGSGTTIGTGGHGSHGGNTAARDRPSLEDDPMAVFQSLAQGAKEAPAVTVGAAASGSSTAPGTPKLGTVPSRGPPVGPIPSANGLTSPLSAVPARVFSSVSTTNTMRSSKSLVDLIAGVNAEPLRGTMPAQQGSRVKHMAFDANCTTAAVLLYDSTVSLWDVASGKCRAQLIRRGERDASRTHSGGVNAVYLTRDGSTAVTISKDYTSRVWDVATASTRFVVEGHTDGVVVAALSRDESLLATGSYDKTVRVTRMAGGSAVAVLDHPQPPAHLLFSPDGRRLAVGLDDSTIVVWDLVGRCCLPSLDAHKAPLTALAWSPDSRFLLSTSEDCTARLWRAEDGRPHAFFMADVGLTAACFTGQHADIIAVGDASGVVHFLDFSEELQG